MEDVGRQVAEDAPQLPAGVDHRSARKAQRTPRVVLDQRDPSIERRRGGRRETIQHPDGVSAARKVVDPALEVDTRGIADEGQPEAIGSCQEPDDTAIMTASCRPFQRLAERIGERLAQIESRHPTRRFLQRGRIPHDARRIV